MIVSDKGKSRSHGTQSLPDIWLQSLEMSAVCLLVDRLSCTAGSFPPSPWGGWAQTDGTNNQVQKSVITGATWPNCWSELSSGLKYL